MKKVHVLAAAALLMGGCSVLGGAMEPKVQLTCPGVSGSIEMTLSESKAFLSDIKAGKTDGEVCMRNAKFCAAAIKVLANGKANCDVKTVL